MLGFYIRYLYISKDFWFRFLIITIIVDLIGFEILRNRKLDNEKSQFLPMYI